MKIKLLTLFILTIYYTTASGQIFDSSQSHYKINWQQINTSKFQLIFPQEFAASAPTLASQLALFIDQTSTDLKRSPKKISIIVQANHLAQNGFVQLAPRKSELYSTPSGVADNQQWLPNLALHESRHFAQFDNLTGKLSKPFFEQLALALFGLNLPSWYFEGDAVLQETLYAEGGRGRLSSWNMPIRANIQSGINFNFNKYVHGSFKDIVPSFYTIGYFMNSELHDKDSQIHGKIIAEMNGKLFRPFNFERSLKKHSGTKSTALFRETMTNLSSQWTQNTASTDSFKFEIKDAYPTHYLLPQTANNTLYTILESRRKTNQIVALQRNENSIFTPKRIVYTGQQVMPYFHIQKNLIVWDEYRKDPRFEKQTYNIINIYDITTRKKRSLTHQSRYYTPILSPDLETVACVEVDLANNSSLVFLNTKNGEITDHIPMPIGTHIQQPQYNTEGDLLIGIAISEKGTNLIQVNVRTKEINYLLDWSNLQLEKPVFAGKDIVYKANYNNKDDIYMLHDSTLSTLTNSKFGAFNPFVENDTLHFNDYTTDGYKPKKIPLAPLPFRGNSKRPIQTLYSKQNEHKIDTQWIANTYEIQKYNVTKNSINFHSLTLSGSDFESFDNLKPGIFWISNDILNTTNAQLGYEYDTELQKSIYSAQVTYQRYFPKLTLSYKNRGQRGQATRNNNPKDILNFDWREHFFTADLQVPFSVFRGNSIYSYGFNFGTSYQKRYDISTSNLENFNTEVSFPLNYQLYFNRNSLRALMDIAPRWGQNLSFTYRHLPFEQNLNASQWSLRTSFYFPGILLNHSLQMRFAMQEKSGQMLFGNDIPLVNGFSYFTSPILANTLLFDYRLPLLYPDWSIGNIAYIKRIRGFLSADYQNIDKSELAPKTFGGGLSFDFNAFKYPLPLFTFSTRLTYINDNTSSQKIAPSFSISYSY